jgi:RES domain-containing protein
VSISIYHGTFVGDVYRQCRTKYAGDIQPTALVAGSLRTGGRWNPPGEFGALYVSIDIDTAVAELCRQIIRDRLRVTTLFPRMLMRFTLSLGHVLDVTHGPTAQAVGLSASELFPESNTDEEQAYAVCRRVGREARSRGFEAIRYPSATGSGENFAIFADQLGATSTTQFTEATELSISEIVRILDLHHV